VKTCAPTFEKRFDGSRLILRETYVRECRCVLPHTCAFVYECGWGHESFLLARKVIPYPYTTHTRVICLMYILYNIILVVSVYSLQSCVFILYLRYDLGSQNVSSILVSQVPNEIGYYATFVGDIGTVKFIRIENRKIFCFISVLKTRYDIFEWKTFDVIIYFRMRNSIICIYIYIMNENSMTV